jgi:GxxExxY protein
MNHKVTKIAKNQIDIEDVGKQIVDAALKVHRALGPGLLESAYQTCLAYELRKRGLDVATELEQPVYYDGQRVEIGYRLDMLVGNCVIIENKAVEQLLPIHEAQLLTYLRLRNCRLGYLINWHVPLIKHGIHRKIIDLKPSPSIKNP